MLPVGLVLRVVPKQAAVDLQDWLKASTQALPEFPLPSLSFYGAGSWEARLVVELRGAIHVFAKEALRLVHTRITGFICGLGFRVNNLGFRVHKLGFRV